MRNGVDHQQLGALLDHLPPTEQRKVLFWILKILSDDHLNRLGDCKSEDSSRLISAVAGTIKLVVHESQTRKAQIVEWLTSSSGAGVGDNVGIRRAVMAVVAQQKDDLIDVLEKLLKQFGDQLYIKHSPMLQQEGNCPMELCESRATLSFNSSRPAFALGCRVRA